MHLMEPNINISNRKRIGLINNRIGNNQHNRNLAFDEIEIGYNDDPLLGPDTNDEPPLSPINNDNNLLTNDYLYKSTIIQNSIVSTDSYLKEPICNGSRILLSDIILILELIKVTNNLGDTVESIVLGLLASILPSDNVIKRILSQQTGSLYFYQKFIKNCHDHIAKCSIHKLDVCINGCIAFVGNNALVKLCPICNTNRDLKNPFQNEIYYFPIKERLLKLLESDLSKLLSYSTLRNKGNNAFFQDIYDGKTWKRFESEMLPNINEKLLGLQWCWDGADAFEFSGKSFWPSCLSILNLPLDLRSKAHIGMHVVSLCTGKSFTNLSEFRYSQIYT